MKTNTKIAKKTEDSIINDYNSIITYTKSFGKNKIEWVNKGDMFQKFTMYDVNYKILPSLESIGSTTLTNNL